MTYDVLAVFAAGNLAVAPSAPGQMRQAVGRTKLSPVIGAGMANYIDGFAFPIPLDRLGDYRRIAEGAAEIWKEHGALDYREFVGDDLGLEGTRSFVDLLAPLEDETIVFGWVVFDSREARDRANRKVASDPRMAALVDASNTGFDARRMAYGGFKSLF